VHESPPPHGDDRREAVVLALCGVMGRALSHAIGAGLETVRLSALLYELTKFALM